MFVAKMSTTGKLRPIELATNLAMMLTFPEKFLALLRRQPTPPEIHVERVKFLSEAAQRGEFPQVFAALNQR